MQLRRFTFRLIVSVLLLMLTFLCPDSVSAQPLKKAWNGLKGLYEMPKKPISGRSVYNGYGFELPLSHIDIPLTLTPPSQLRDTPSTINVSSLFLGHRFLKHPKIKRSSINRSIELNIDPIDYIAVLEALCGIPSKSICGTWRIMKHMDNQMNAKILLLRKNSILTNIISEYGRNANNEYIVISSDGKIVFYPKNQAKIIIYEDKLPKIPLLSINALNVKWLSENMITIDVYKDLLDSPESFHDSNGKDFQPQLSRPEGTDVTPTSTFDNADEREELEEYQPSPSEKESINVILKDIERWKPSIRDYQDGNETKDVFRLRISPSEGIGTGFVKIENSRYDTEFQRAA